MGCLLFLFCLLLHDEVGEFCSDGGCSSLVCLGVFVCEYAVDCLDEGFFYAAFFEGVEEFVAADGVCFVYVCFDCVCCVCEGVVEEPVVQWKSHVGGVAGVDVCAVDGGWFFEAVFCAAVNRGTNRVV